MKKQKLMSVKEYAAKNGVSERTIYNRIDERSIAFVYKGAYFIDVSQSPVHIKKKIGRPSCADILASS